MRCRCWYDNIFNRSIYYYFDVTSLYFLIILQTIFMYTFFLYIRLVYWLQYMTLMMGYFDSKKVCFVIFKQLLAVYYWIIFLFYYFKIVCFPLSNVELNHYHCFLIIIWEPISSNFLFFDYMQLFKYWFFEVSIFFEVKLTTDFIFYIFKSQ